MLAAGRIGRQTRPGRPLLELRFADCRCSGGSRLEVCRKSDARTRPGSGLSQIDLPGNRELPGPHVPAPLPFPQQFSGLPAGDLAGNREVPGAKSAKNHSKNSKKARSAFLFFLFFLVQGAETPYF